MAHQEPIRKRPPGPMREIPDKLYFRIGEVAKLCEVPAYVLRFWEGEFPQLKPNKGGSGQRLYRRRDVEMALRIKALLYDEGYTIAGARQAFKAELRTSREPQLDSEGVAQAGDRTVDASHIEALQKELRELHAQLSRPAARSSVQSIRPPRTAAASKPLPPPTPFPKPHSISDRRKGPSLGPSLYDSLFDDLPDA